MGPCSEAAGLGGTSELGISELGISDLVGLPWLSLSLGVISVIVRYLCTDVMRGRKSAPIPSFSYVFTDSLIFQAVFVSDIHPSTFFLPPMKHVRGYPHRFRSSQYQASNAPLNQKLPPRRRKK